MIDRVQADADFAAARTTARMVGAGTLPRER